MAASDDGETLETLLNKATNPANRDEDWEYIMNFCDRVNFELEGCVIACRLLGHKIQSPQEREAMQALTVVEACVKNCGELFHKEIGKFRFLNEMIKLISPKYLGNKTTEKVKKKTIEMLYSWQSGLPNEIKIREAYDMLKKQGLVTEDPTYVDQEFFPPPPARDKAASFEDEDKSKLLSRLLKSKHPEDLQAANRLIKNMVKEDEKKMEKVAKRLNELESCNNNVKLLNEMLTHFQPGVTSEQERELMKELYLACEKLRPSLFRLASDTDEKDDSIADILQTNDSLVKVMDLYKDLIGDIPTRSGDGDTQLMDNNSTPKSTQREPTSSLLDLEGLDAAPLSFQTMPQAPAGQMGNQMGNSIQTLPQQQPVTNNNSTQLLHDQLSSLGINNNVSQAASTAQTTAFTRKSVTQPTSATDLENILGPSPVPSAPTPATDTFGVFRSQPLQPQPTMPVNVGMGSTPISSNMATAPMATAPMATNMAFSSTMATPSLNSSQASRPNYAPSNQISPKGDNAKPVPSSAFADLENLSKTMMQTAAGKQPPANQPSTVQTAPAQAPSVVNTTTAIPTQPQPAQLIQSQPAQPQTPPSSVLSLADVFVPLESIQPGTIPPITAYEKNGIKMVFHIGKDRPRPDVTVIVVSTMSSNTSPVKSLSFQAAVPKVMRVKLQPPSATDLPAFNPILPPAAITQVMLIANPQKKDIRLRFKVQFMFNEQQVTDVGDVSSIPAQ